MTDLTKALAASDPEFARAIEDNKRKRKLAVALRSLRHAAHLTQVEVAERSGLKQSHISKLEAATGAMPTIETLLKYAAACNAELSLDFNLAPDDDTDVLDVSVGPVAARVALDIPLPDLEKDVESASTLRVVKGSLNTTRVGRVPLAQLSVDQIRAVERGEKVEIKSDEVIETVLDVFDFHVLLT
ncbi:helix-turn-helix transcriptional regulator [Roseovarius sp. CAU 1744]|uniref:helix-turn-helix domain-containing protein n=1 Tax=Roseovarius sp. CAU 1744 TaxID=3140368 RepID=UPI00325B3847